MPKEQMKFVPKGWGSELWIHNGDLYCGKKLTLMKGKKGSLHYHKNKTETFFLQSGKLRLELKYADGSEETLIMEPGDAVHLPAGTIHRYTGLEDSEMFEFSTKHDDSDTYRIEPGD